MSLSPNQHKLLSAVADEPKTTGDLAKLTHAEHGGELGDDAARNIMSRMESRDLVTGSGPGRARKWSALPAGVQELVAGAAPAENGGSPDSSPESASRSYVVLEEIDLWHCIVEHLPEDLLTAEPAFMSLLENALGGNKVYEIAHEPVARNADHAMRLAGKAAFADGQRPILVPVADRYWRPEPVTVTSDTSVHIG